MLKLQFRDGRKAAIWLVDSRYSIGRDSSNDIIIDQEGVGNFHAELQVEDDDRIFITDAGSLNGTSVNGKRIKGRTQLRANDVISIYTVELKLSDPKEELQPAGTDAATAISPALQGLQSSASPAGEGSGWKLTAKTGSLLGKSYSLPVGKPLIIGRSKNCDIVLPSNHVSRQHAEVRVDQGKLYVKDLGSSNGTYVNRKKVQEGIVNPGDELRFDTLVFSAEGPGDEPQEQGEATQFRAAIDPDAVASGDRAKPAARPAAASAPAATARPAPAQSAPAMDVVEPEAKAKSGAIWLVLLGVFVVVGGLAVWLMR